MYKILFNILLSRKLLGIISVDFAATGQQLIIYSSLIKCLKKKEYDAAVYQLLVDLKKTYYLFRRKVLYKILIQFGIPVKLVRLIKMCLTETFSGVRIGKNLSNVMLIKLQLDTTVCRYLFTTKSLYMFCVSKHPSSGVLKTVTAASGTGHNTGAATSLQRGPMGHVGGK